MAKKKVSKGHYSLTENDLYKMLKANPTLENLQYYKLHKMMHKFWLRFEQNIIDEILTCGKEVI